MQIHDTCRHFISFSRNENEWRSGKAAKGERSEEGRGKEGDRGDDGEGGG